VATTTQVLFETGDITSLASISSALRKIVDKVGLVDIFASNAGVLRAQGPVVGYDESELREIFETNVMGAFNSLQAFAPLAAPNAKLFNTSSGIAHFAPKASLPCVFSYAATKAAAVKMIDYFAAENPGIHVVSVQPGIIATEVNPNITSGPDTGMDYDLDSLLYCFNTNSIYTVELPAHFLVWLASDEAKFLKGKFVWANWDTQELMARADEIQQSMLLRVSLNGVDM
jgi:NAD(P)-dependent dehydrogenase (short-subunit alcohol dehydrogenase family)